MTPAQVAATVTAAALLGLSTSLHCATMCGPLCAAACSRGGKHALLRYQVGRGLGYSLAGVIAARFSAAFVDLLPHPFARILLPSLTALACVVVALQLWPAMISAKPTLVKLRPKKKPREDIDAGEYNPEKAARTRPIRTSLLALLPRNTWVLGIGTTLLPCGALAGALLMAAGQGNGLAGGLFMLAFALVSGFSITVPAVLSRALSRASARSLWGLRRMAAIGLVALAIIMISSPLRALWLHPGASHGGASSQHVHPSCH